MVQWGWIGGSIVAIWGKVKGFFFRCLASRYEALDCVSTLRFFVFFDFVSPKVVERRAGTYMWFHLPSPRALGGEVSKNLLEDLGVGWVWCGGWLWWGWNGL